jgi:hypothetical protein
MGGWLTLGPGRFTPGNDPVPIYRRMCVPQFRSGRVRKISRSPGFYSQTVQPVASCYTDYSILAHKVSQFPYQTKYMSSSFLIVIPKYTFLNVFTSL